MLPFGRYQVGRRVLVTIHQRVLLQKNTYHFFPQWLADSLSLTKYLRSKFNGRTEPETIFMLIKKWWADTRNVRANEYIHIFLWNKIRRPQMEQKSTFVLIKIQTKTRNNLSQHSACNQIVTSLFLNLNYVRPLYNTICHMLRS